MAAKTASKKRKTKRRARSSPKLVRAAQWSGGLAHEVSLLIGPILVVVGFLQPWLIVETSPLAAAIFDLPPSASLSAPDLPGYAHEVEKSWVVELVRLFESDRPETGRIWWVYASPISALLAYFGLRNRRILAAALALTTQGFLALLGSSKLIEGLSNYSSDSVEVHFGYGLAIATLGHAWLLALALKVLDRSLMRRLFGPTAR